jgi:transposase-like protein
MTGTYGPPHSAPSPPGLHDRQSELHEGQARPHEKDAFEVTSTGTTIEQSADNAELRKRIRLLEQENEVLRQAAAYLSQANLPGNDLPARP